MLRIKSTSLLVCLPLVFSFLLYSAYILTSAGILDSGDGITHYQISHFSFFHPELFLHHWGKPLFTLLSSPFSQLGFKGLQVFNSFLAVLTGFITYKVAQKLDLSYAWFSIILVCFAPIYFKVTLSGLTEILFSFLLISAIYLVIVKKMIWAGILISFMPFSRPEAYMIMPLFILFFIYSKNYKAIIASITGILIYSIIGWAVLGNFWWLITDDPYDKTGSLYGSGNFSHFFNSYRGIVGNPILFLFAIGIIYYTILIIKKKHSFFLVEELILIFGSFLSCIFFHSFFWSKGIFGSMGLIRVIATVIPCIAIVTMYSVKMIDTTIKSTILKSILLGALFLLVIYVPLKTTAFPIQQGNDQTKCLEISKWFKSSKFKNNPIVFMHQYLGFVLEADPFDTKTTTLMYDLNQSDPSINLKSGTVVFWDSSFSSKEGKQLLSNFTENKNFELIFSFSSDNRETENTNWFIFKRN